MNLIVAIDEKNGIGLNNKIPWHIPEDLKYFKTITTDNIIVMGKNTHNSIGKKLDNRINIIMTHNPIHNCISINNIDSVLEKYNNNNIYIIGGESIYKQFLDRCKFLYITKIFKDFKCDTFFPEYLSKYDLINESSVKIHNRIHYQFCVYKKK